MACPLLVNMLSLILLRELASRHRGAGCGHFRGAICFGGAPLFGALLDARWPPLGAPIGRPRVAGRRHWRLHPADHRSVAALLHVMDNICDHAHHLTHRRCWLSPSRSSRRLSSALASASASAWAFGGSGAAAPVHRLPSIPIPIPIRIPPFIIVLSPS
jgi:hypothetical protein